VLDLGPPGSWDDASLHSPTVLYDESMYHMWYGGVNGPNSRIGYANSTDGINWTKNPGNPVLDLGLSGSWDDIMVYPRTVFSDGTVYHMLYSGKDGSNTRIGHATYGIDLVRHTAYSEVLDAFEITEINAGISYTIDLNVPSTADLDMFIFKTTGGRNDALASSTNFGTNTDELITFTASMTGDYLLVIINQDGGIGAYSVSFDIQDTNPPLITDVIVDPDPQEVYGHVRISATITDDIQLGGSWVRIYDPTGTFLGNFSLLYDSINDKWYNEQDYDTLGEYTFTIYARDVNYNWVSASDSFIIEDTTPPTIEDVTVIPNPHEVFGALEISATITDNYQLFDSWIEIYDPDGDLIDNFTMTYDTMSSKYKWGDTFDLIGDYSYTIYSNDSADNWNSFLGNFSIQDTINPIILDDKATPDPQEVFGTVTISTNVTDNYELEEVTVEIRDSNNNLLVDFPMEQNLVDLTYYWTQSYSLLGTYTYTIRANDTSNNIASISGSFLIQDTTPPVISNIEKEPDLPEEKDLLNILATVTDNYQLFGVWIEIYNSDGVSYGNHSMDYDTVYGRYFLNQSYNKSGAYTFTIWANDTSDNWVSTSGLFEVDPEPELDEYNWKPIIALIFSIILLIVGILIVQICPMRFTGELSKDKWYSLLAGVLPFVVAEAITGVISFFTGLLAVPPLLGIGMIVDLAIFGIGLAICVVIYLKGIPSESYIEEPPPPTEEEQTPPKTFEQDDSEIPPSPSDELPPITSNETQPPLPPPAPPEDTPPEPPYSPYEEILPPF
jgi:hypothetical protein